MRTLSTLGSGLALLLALLPASTAASSSGSTSIRFEANLGQCGGQVRFLARAAGYTLYLTPQTAILALRDGARSVVRVRFAGAAAAPRLSGVGPLAGVSNYFLGKDPKKWATGAPHFASVRYREIYPGVDVVFRDGDGIEFDFVLAPGADPDLIAMDFEGASGIALEPGGDVLLGLPNGDLRLRRPILYQEANGVRSEVPGGYRIEGASRVAFRCGPHDAQRPLVIDPAIVASTFLGGSGREGGSAIARDAAGYVYVTGTTDSLDFPFVGGFQPDRGPSFTDAFVSKLDLRTGALVYSTYVGGGGEDHGESIAVDSAGSAYVGGTTASRDFPVTPGAFQTTTSASSANYFDGFVLKLSPDGSRLLYSTYLGGISDDQIHALALDAQGNAYVTGSTTSLNFPSTPGAFQTQPDRWEGADVFVSKLDPTGSRLVYSTFVAGSATERGYGIAVDAAGNAYVTGNTGFPADASTDFPLKDPFQSKRAGGYDVFVTKLNAAGSALVWSTYLGGSGFDVASGLALDGAGNVYLAGSSESTDFPVTVGAFDNENDGEDAFVAKVTASGSGLAYATFLGSRGRESAYGIAVDAQRCAIVVGSTDNPYFPMASPVQSVYGGDESDGFLTKLDPTGSELLFSTYLGGSRRDAAVGVTVDASGAAYVTGGTGSPDFPIANPYQAVYAGPSGYQFEDGDVFVMKIDLTPAAVTHVVPVILVSSGVAGSYYTSELALTNRGTSPATLELTYTAATGGGSGSTTDTVAPGRQRIVPDAIAYLRALGVPIPDSGNRVGTLRVRFSGLSSPGAAAVTVRTTTLVSGGRAGLAYAGVPAAETLTGTAYLCGLRQNGEDRSNVAILNAGGPEDGDVVLRLTIRSGTVSKVLPDETLGPGAFKQFDQILTLAGVTNGYVIVQRTGGSAPYYAYGVINDQFNSDGSFVQPFAVDGPGLGDGYTLPVVVESSPFTTEVILTNIDTTSRPLRLTYVSEALQTGNKQAVTTVTLEPGEQLVLPNFVQYLRSRGVAGVGPAGPTFAGALFVTSDSGQIYRIVAGARTAAPGGGGRYGVFYGSVEYAEAATSVVWLFGLRQDGENRTNLALVNTGEKGGSVDGFRLEIFDGDTGALVRTVDGLSLASRRWMQINAVLSQYAPGTGNAYLRITRTSGTNPYLAYGVINDGAVSGERSGDGAFLPMRMVR